MKGAFNIVAAIGLLLSMVFVGALMPTIITQTGVLVNASSGSPVTQAVAWLIPLSVVVALIIGIMSVAQPQQTYDVGY